jgi:uncharacterized damage-inducible protein DinB
VIIEKDIFPLPWFERTFTFGKSVRMLPYYLERLEGTLTRISAKVHGYDDTILSKRKDGKWSVKEHIGHLAEVDEISNQRLTEMISGKAFLSPAVFEPKDYSTWNIEEVLAYFSKSRLSNLESFRQLTNEQLTSFSMHPRLHQAMTPIDLAWFDAEHDDHHLVAISRILKNA